MVPEGIAAAARSESPAGSALRWFTEPPDISLLITGEDRWAPLAIARRLGATDAALDRKLDGELADSRDAELAAALEAHV